MHSRAINSPYVFDKAGYHRRAVKGLRLPRRHAYVHTAPYFGWLAEREMFSEKFAAPLMVRLLRWRVITPMRVCAHFNGRLTDDMLTFEARAFSMCYFDFEYGQYLTDYCAVSGSTFDNMLRTRFTWELYQSMLDRIDERFRRWGGRIRAVQRA
jgi:hypothetical protein